VPASSTGENSGALSRSMSRFSQASRCKPRSMICLSSVTRCYPTA
jgi:hypothetical protein